ncbi:MAG: hypothetical protein RQ877_04145, partial [Vulcanisaeta sp.]|nr:hypothetical protein [Vulcanisaeta sp.]
LMMSSLPFSIEPGSSLVIYYPHNGRTISTKLPTGVNVLTRRYYDLGSLLWFVEAWYWEPRYGFIYFESGPHIHPKAPAMYLVVPPRSTLAATDGGSRMHYDKSIMRNASLIFLKFLIMPLIYLLSIININVVHINTSVDELLSRDSAAHGMLGALMSNAPRRGWAWYRLLPWSWIEQVYAY